MTEVFVQVNSGSFRAISDPIGYHIRENGCWEWQGADTGRGYGQITKPGSKRMQLAHRWMYERANGSIPKGLQLDHLCRNRRCVNPDHLEAVTCRENILRGESFAASQSRQTHCKRGHKFTPKNTYRPRRGGRSCRTCICTLARLRYHRKRGRIC